ncbi:MAG TPA: NAD-dependent deacylase [Drouetiella sp.]
MSLEESLLKASALMKDVKSVAVLTGAGISKESGIPTFREAQTGLWANYEPEKLATVEGFRRDPSLVWKWYDWRRKMVADVVPNPGHLALVDLEKLFPQFTLITQNVDGLHRRAGSVKVIEMHGNISKHKCLERNHPAENVAFDLENPPECSCGSCIRPDVVWFGEALKTSDLDQSFAAAESAEIFLVVGTSGLVQPAASLPFMAQRNGAKVIECNPERTPLTADADVLLEGPSGKVLPMLVEQLKQSIKQ